MPYQKVLYPFTSEIFVYASVVQVYTCLASFALSRAIVAVSSARAAAMLLLAHLVFRALISLPSVSRWRMATFRSFSLFEVSDSIWKNKWIRQRIWDYYGKGLTLLNQRYSIWQVLEAENLPYGLISKEGRHKTQEKLIFSWSKYNIKIYFWLMDGWPSILF